MEEVSMSDRRESWSRRGFVQGLMLAGTVGLLGVRGEQAAAEPPPETTKVRILRTTDSTCVAPLYVAEDLLRAEGFVNMSYVRGSGGLRPPEQLAGGQADFAQDYVVQHIMRVDAGDKVVALAGIHPGCAELFVRDNVRSVQDLRGKTIGFPGVSEMSFGFLAAILGYVGLDHRRDVQLVMRSRTDSVRLLAEGQIDGFFALPPHPQEMRARGIGRALVNIGTDRPWSQYFCCMLIGSRDFVQKHPMATRRVVRAMLKATTLCAREPERAAERLADEGIEYRRDYALQALREIPYDRWREYDPADTVRFYALRLREAGLIKSSAQKIIAQGTDWRFFNELKKELKG
jgi:NitT/TauT family transport system substrate-binding protein